MSGEVNEVAFDAKPNGVSNIPHDENSQGAQEMPHLRSSNLDQKTAECEHGMEKSANQRQLAAARPANALNTHSNTVPQPFILATEKRASGRNRAIITEATIDGDKTARVNDPQSADTQNKSQGNSPLTSRKPWEVDSTVHTDNEDSCSVASTAPSVRTWRSRATVAITPTFRCNDRAEKRKEFYNKLEEKHQALEAEKIQSEARIRDEQEAALKELRKSLTFKANPIPSFYYEGPPAKVDLKKVPPTRAISPKFNRRKSYNDATPTEGNNCNGSCGRFHRHNLATNMEATKRQQNSSKNVKSKGLKSRLPSIKATGETTAGVTVLM